MKEDASGWATADEVVLIEQGADFFADQIRANSRGTVSPTQCEASFGV